MTQKEPDRKIRRDERVERRERFARSMARDAFGRHYWDEGQARELQRSLAEPKRSKGRVRER